MFTGLGAMKLSLKLLGGFAIRDGAEKELFLRTRKTRALLAYLAVNADKPQPRERLMALLWSDRSEQQARQSLNQALVSIRHLVDGGDVPLLESDGIYVTLRGDALQSDVAQFRSAVANEPAKAAAVYDGPFVDGMSAPDPAFEEWLRTTRSALQSLACEALNRSAIAAEDGGDLENAINSARRLIALDPLNEDAHRRLMRLLHRSGDRASALRQYHACAEILREELDVEPNTLTQALFAEIRQDGDTTKKETRTPASPKSPPPLPDKPSIAVLPFKNLSADPEQEYFSDGITDDIITDLSKVSGLFVVARNSTFVFKGKAEDVSQIARQLGVHYVLEGSIRKGGGRVRVNAQLVDAIAGNHLWADRYDEDLADIFAVQDKITERIVGTLAITLTRVEQSRAMRKEAQNLKAYDFALRGNAYHHRLTKDDNVKARENYEQAIKIDPGYAPAYAGLAWVLNHDANQGWGYDFHPLLNRALETAKKAVELDDSLAKAHLVLGDVLMWMRMNDQAVEEGQKAIALDPNYADGHFALSAYLRYAGKAEEALDEIRIALRLNPLHGNRLYYFGLGRTQYALKQYDAAVDAGKQLVIQNPDVKGNHLLLAAAYAQLGRNTDAERHTREILRMDPTFSATDYIQFLPFKNKADADHYLDGLRKAGLPE